MKMLRMIRRDLNNGLIQKWYRYLPVIIITAFMCRRQWIVSFRTPFENGLIATKGTFFDYLLGVNPGTEVFDVKERFIIPIYWLVFQMSVHYIISDYARDDFKEYGRNLMPRAGSCGNWWISKCVWCVVTVISFYMLMLMTTLLMTKVITGHIGKGFTETVQVLTGSKGMQYVMSEDIPVMALLVPFVATLSLCFIQMLFSFFLTPEISYALICGIYVLSDFYNKWWLPGGFTMWVRSSYVSAGGLEPKTGIVMGCVIISACIIFGKVYFDEKDIL